MRSRRIPGRLADPTLPTVPADLPGWYWERADHLLRLVCVATAWSTPWKDEETTEQTIAIARRYVRVMELDEEPMTVQTESAPKVQPGSSIETLLQSHGWTWHAETNQGRQGYLFHNKATYQSCWYPSLEKRLLADAQEPTLYTYIEAGWTAPALGDRNAQYMRPPSVPEQQSIAIDAIRRGRYQPRRTFSDEELQDLANSITAHGILTRLKVFVNERGEYELIAGERRLRAAKLAELEHVPVEVCEYTLAQIHEISIIDNLQRENLSPVEEGIAYERLAKELGISESELSRRMGKNRAYVQQRRAIGRAAPEIQQALTSGELTFSQVRGLCLGSADNHKVQLATLKKLRDLKKNGRQINERDAQHEAEVLTLKQVKKDLEGLGWKVIEGGNAPGSGIWLWSDGERPRSFTSAELLTLVHERAYQVGRLRLRDRSPRPRRRSLRSEAITTMADSPHGWCSGVALIGISLHRWKCQRWSSRSSRII